ncbi:MAG: OmpH family outer membrane protein [Aureliella sp.]|jgi:Skp family chaperone for outer membrane proteins
MPRVAHAKRKQGVLNVCIRSFVVTLVAGLSLVTATAQAQGTAQSAGGAPQQAASAPRRQVPVAVIDLGYILKNHPTMKQKIEGIKSQSETVGAEFEKKRQSILKMMEELRENYTEGTPDYMRKEQEIAEQDTQFRLDVVRKNKEFDEARAQIFFEVHQQVSTLVKFYCDNMGTFVVLKVAREKPDPKKPETIEIAMGQEVFYHQNSPDVDITDWVLQNLKSQASQTATPTQTNTATRPTAGAQLK